MKLPFVTPVCLMLIVLAVSAEKYFFRELPPIVVDTGYAHVTASVNFTHIELEIRSLKAFSDFLDRKTELPKYKNNTYIVALRQVVHESTQQVNFEWHELKSLVGHQPKVQRFLATLGALAIGAFAGSGLFGMLQTQDVSALHQNVDHLLKRQDHIVTHIHHQDQHIHQHDLAIIDLAKQFRRMSSWMNTNQILTEMDAVSLYVTALSTRLLDQIQALKQTIILAKYNRINPEFFSTKFLEKSISNISRKLPNNYDLVSKHFIDWYSYETSMVLQTNGFFIVIHVPFFNPSHLFRAQHFQSLPMHAQNNNSFLVIQPESPILGLNKQKKFFIELTESQLQNCHLISSKYICPQIKILRKDFEKSCIFQLLQNQQAKAAKLCPSILAPQRELVIEISKSTFLFILPSDKMILQICPNRSEQIPVYHQRTVSIPAHCYIETSSSLIFPTKSVFTSSEITFYKFDPLHFNPNDGPKFNLKNATVNIKKYDSYVDILPQTVSSNYVHGLLIALILIAVILIMFMFCVYYKVPAAFAPQ